MSFRPRASLVQRLCRILLLLWMVANIGLAVSYASPSSDGEEQNRRSRQEAQERQQRDQQKDVFLQKGAAAARDFPLPDETPSFFITTLLLKGDSVERIPWAQEMLQHYAGRKIGLVGINLLANRLANALIDQGYITSRIVIPEQDLSSGTLTFVLVPGRIGAIRLDEASGRKNWQTAFPTRPGDILNLRHLEQGLEQMKRVPSQDVEMQIQPGANPGESDVVISVKETQKWRLTLTTDDSGVIATGKIQTSEALAMDNLLGLNDLFNISFNSDGDRRGYLRGTRGDSIYYSLPYGDSTFTYSNYTYHYHQYINDSSSPFQFSGEITNASYGISQLLHRDQTSKTSLDFSLIKGTSRSFIEDTEIEVQRQITTAAQLGLTQRRYLGQATLDTTLANKRGVPWWGAQLDPAAQSAGSPTTRYSIWLLDTSLTTPVAIGDAKGRYTVTLHGQYCRNLLFASEFVSIGNRFTVRGFDGEQTLSAERGWYLRNEVAVPLSAKGLEIYAGLDGGQVGGPSAQTLLGRTLIGSVAGLRGSGKNLSYEFFIGWPLKKPAGFHTASPTFGFQSTYQI
ncbi:MAG: ShlB/FhaC/HecB family hemolysin secretion/activation protein [Negativicutes bacterium]|nr:ShlB/FhaC/HecB family hemolysin secretion/activation protein [Negativicutes bacterium]MDR3590725.1 ShlB/FhaC/HecB family hemolysin secretion/activation protein [Negativicutes bacterium]